MPAAPSRRLIAVSLAAAYAAAVIGAAVLWLPRGVPRSGGAPPVIGAPGAPVPTIAAPSGQPGLSQSAPTPAPAFTLPVLSPGAARSSGAAPPAAPAAGQPPAGIPPAGARLALAALRGHPVVVNFWASWCAPCRAEMPMLVKTWHAYAPRGVVVLGLDVDDTPVEARRFLADYHVDYPIATVVDERLPRAYGVVGLPTTVFVDASGVIRARQLGQFEGPDGERTLRRQIEALLAGEPR